MHSPTKSSILDWRDSFGPIIKYVNTDNKCIYFGRCDRAIDIYPGVINVIRIAWLTDSLIELIQQFVKDKVAPHEILENFTSLEYEQYKLCYKVLNT